MTPPLLPEDPESTDVSPPHQWVRRKKTGQDYIATIGGLVAIVATLAGFASYAAGKMPWVKIDVYDKDQAERDLRVLKVEATTQTLNANMETVRRNGLLTLQLQLQQRIDALAATLKTMPPNSQSFYQLSVAHDEAAQQIEEIKRQLRK